MDCSAARPIHNEAMMPTMLHAAKTPIQDAAEATEEAEAVQNLAKQVSDHMHESEEWSAKELNRLLGLQLEANTRLRNYIHHITTQGRTR